MATIYLHIGLPKTGTSSIQYFMWAPENRALLEQHGICYPEMGFRYRMVSKYRNAHFLLRTPGSMDESDKHYKDYETGLDKVSELAAKYDKILLFDEAIWAGSLNRDNFWPRLKNDLDERGLDIRIIVYFRRQDQWVESLYAQKIKSGMTCKSFSDYLQQMREVHYPVDFCAYLDMLSDIFGKEALVPRVFERGQFRGPEGTIHSDFLDILGLTMADGFTISDEVRNARYDGNYLEFRRLLTQLPEYQRNYSDMAPHIKAVQHENIWDYDYRSYTYFSHGERDAFFGPLEESNRRLAKTYLDRPDGVLFREGPRELQPFVVKDSELLRDTILIYGRAYYAMMEQHNALAKQQETLARRYDTLAKRYDTLSDRYKTLARDHKALTKDHQALVRQFQSLSKYSPLYRLKNLVKRLLGRK